MNIIEKKRLLKDVTITHVSYVKRGANKKQFFLAKNDCSRADIQFDMQFFSKSDDDERKLLYGVVYEPDVEDSHGDAMTKDEIEKTAHEFLEFYRNIDTEHNMLAGAGTVVESYVTPIEMKIGKNVIKAGSWILVTRATDEIWDAWKAGDITGYSMFGISRETQMSKGENKLKKFLENIMSKVGLSKAFNETIETTLEQLTRDPCFLMDMLQKDFFESISWESALEDDLKTLSLSMRSAADYIDGKIADIAKSDDSKENAEEHPAENQEETPAEEPETAEETTKDEAEPENEAPAETETEPEEVGKSAEKLFEEMFEKVVKSNGDILNTLLSEKLNPVLDTVKTLTKTIETLEDKIQDLETGSSVKTQPPQTDVKKSRNPALGLLS